MLKFSYLSFLSFLIFIPFLNAQTVDITYPVEISGSPGETVLFPIFVSDIPASANVLSLAFIFEFENEYIEDIELVSQGSFIPFQLFGNRNFNVPDFRVGGFGATPINGSGELFTLEITLGEATPTGGALFTVTSSTLNGPDQEPFLNPSAPVAIPLQIFGVDFSLDLNIQDAGSGETTLTIGTASDATPGNDSQYDIVAPPSPPAGAFDARITTPGNDYLTFFQPTTTTVTTWDIQFQPQTGNEPITISWDPGELNTTGFFRITDTIDGTFILVDMRTESSVTVTNPAIENLQITHEILSETYESGWSLVGVPVVPIDPNVFEIFGDVTPNSLYRFEGTYIPETDLEAGTGYWLNRQQADTVIFDGELITSITISLQPGWNIISGISIPAVIEDTGNIIQPGTLYGFDGAYQEVSVLQPGRGYWVQATQAGEIQVVGLE